MKGQIVLKLGGILLLMLVMLAMPPGVTSAATGLCEENVNGGPELAAPCSAITCPGGTYCCPRACGGACIYIGETCTG